MPILLRIGSGVSNFQCGIAPLNLQANLTAIEFVVCENKRLDFAKEQDVIGH